MKKPEFEFQALFVIGLFMMMGVNVAVVADQAQAKQGTQAESTQTATQSKGQIYGSQLMTRQERAEYRAKMRSLKTREERESFRAEHHKKMQERAKEMGKTIPEVPPARGCWPRC